MEALELDPASEEIRSVFTDCTILKKRNLFHCWLSFWMILAGRSLGL